jgi:glycerophosphoryl diester phosphodiesterase
MSFIKVIGHRGNGRTDTVFGASKAPQSTLLSFGDALRFGADGIEFDVFASSDNIPFIVDKNDVDGVSVSALNSHELRQVRLPNDQRIPSVYEVLGFIARGIQTREFKNDTIVNIELKGDGVVEPTLEAIEQASLRMGFDPRLVCFSSFDQDKLALVRGYDTDAKIQPTIATMRLFGADNVVMPGYRVRQGLGYDPHALQALADFVSEKNCSAIDIPTHDVRPAMVSFAQRLNVGFCTHPTPPRHVNDIGYLDDALAILHDYAATGGHVCLKVDDVASARALKFTGKHNIDHLERIMGMPFLRGPSSGKTQTAAQLVARPS